MERFAALGRGLQIMLVAGVLLLIDTFLDWQSVDLPDPLGSVGVSAWDDLGGILLGLLTIVLIVWIGVRLVGVAVPLPVSQGLIAGVLAALILALALIKNLQDDNSSVWAWIGLLLAVAIAVGAWLVIQESGGVESLRSEVAGMSGLGAAAPQPPPAAPAAPEPTPPPEATSAPPPAGEPEERPRETS